MWLTDDTFKSLPFVSVYKLLEKKVVIIMFRVQGVDVVDVKTDHAYHCRFVLAMSWTRLLVK